MLFNVRRLLYVVLICLLLVPLAVMAQEDLTETYTSDDGFVEFQYPADWVVIEEEGEIILSNSATRTDLMEPPTGDEVAVLMIPVVTQYPFFPFFEPGSSASEIAEIMLEDFLVASDDAVISPVEELQVGPYSAATTSALESLQEIIFYILVLDAETHVMAMIAIADSSETVTANEETILAIAETFAFTGDPSTIGMLNEAGSLSYGEVVTGDLQNPDGDGWTFTGEAGDVVTIALDSDDFDAYVELFDPDENLVASDDDGGGSLNSLIRNFELPADGTYTINARSFSSSESGTYTLSLSTGEVAELPPASKAGPISYGETVTGDLQVDDGDRWTFTGSAGDVVTIALDSNDFDAYLELLDADGNIIASDDDSGGDLNARISGFALPADGEYSINARGWSSSERGLYTLELSTGAPTASEAGSISYGETVSGDLQVDDGDAWTFTGSAGDVVTIALESDDFDTYLELFGPDGALLVSDDDSGGNLNSLIDGFTLPASGEYSIAARGFSPTARGVYTLELSSS